MRKAFVYPPEPDFEEPGRIKIYVVILALEFEEPKPIYFPLPIDVDNLDSEFHEWLVKGVITFSSGAFNLKPKDIVFVGWGNGT